MKRKLEKSMEKMYTASIIILSILFVLVCISSFIYIGENRSLKANNEFLKEMFPLWIAILLLTSKFFKSIL